MADVFKQLDAQKDIVPQTFPIESSLYTITGQAQATTYDTKIYTIGQFPGFINKPDSLGSTSAGISPSGTMNSISKKQFGRYSSQYFSSPYNIYTIPASHTANLNVVAARVIEVSNPTKDSGIWADTVTAVLTYKGVSVTAVDSSSDSFGPNKESLSYGKLTDINDNNLVYGSIFYDDGLILLHGGTGTVGASFYDASVTGFAFRGSITGALSASTTATHVVVETLSFRTYQYLTRNIIFCTASPNEFNYTSNPSAAMVDFLQRPENATTYITTVGLYNDKDELLAVAKISPPYRKNPYRVATFAITISV